MRFYGIADTEIEEVILWFSTCGEAEAERRKMIRDEPAWVETMRVVRIDLAGAEPVVRFVG